MRSGSVRSRQIALRPVARIPSGDFHDVPEGCAMSQFRIFGQGMCGRIVPLPAIKKAETRRKGDATSTQESQRALKAMVAALRGEKGLAEFGRFDVHHNLTKD